MSFWDQERELLAEIEAAEECIQRRSGVPIAGTGKQLVLAMEDCEADALRYWQQGQDALSRELGKRIGQLKRDAKRLTGMVSTSGEFRQILHRLDADMRALDRFVDGVLADCVYQTVCRCDHNLAMHAKPSVRKAARAAYRVRILSPTHWLLMLMMLALSALPYPLGLYASLWMAAPLLLALLLVCDIARRVQSSSLTRVRPPTYAAFLGFLGDQPSTSQEATDERKSIAKFNASDEALPLQTVGRGLAGYAQSGNPTYLAGGLGFYAIATAVGALIDRFTHPSLKEREEACQAVYGFCTTLRELYDEYTGKVQNAIALYIRDVGDEWLEVYEMCVRSTVRYCAAGW